MSFMINVCDAVFEQMYSEACLEKILACVADTIFGGNAAYIYIGRVQKFEYLAQ